MIRDVGALFHCLACDSVFVIVVSAVNLQNFSGSKKKELLDVYESIQSKLYSLNWKVHDSTQRRFRSVYPFRCPRCIELIFGKRFLEWLDDPNSDYVDSPCLLVTFTTDGENEIRCIPLYINIANSTEEKPKWELCSGIGPPSLVLGWIFFVITFFLLTFSADKTHRANIIYKPALKEAFFGNRIVSSCEMYRGFSRDHEKPIR